MVLEGGIQDYSSCSFLELQDPPKAFLTTISPEDTCIINHCWRGDCSIVCIKIDFRGADMKWQVINKNCESKEPSILPWAIPRFICTSLRLREIPKKKWRSGKQSWLITGQAGTLFLWVTSLVPRGVRLVPRTCFSPQSRILRAEDKSDRVCSSCGRKWKPSISCIRLCQAPCLVLKTRRVRVKRDSSARFKRCLTTSVSSPDWITLGRKNLETCTSQCSCVAWP